MTKTLDPFVVITPSDYVKQKLFRLRNNRRELSTCIPSFTRFAQSIVSLSVPARRRGRHIRHNSAHAPGATIPPTCAASASASAPHTPHYATFDPHQKQKPDQRIALNNSTELKPTALKTKVKRPDV